MSSDIREHSIMIADLAYDEGREAGSKVRPAFVVKYDNQKIAYYKITSQFNNKSDYFQNKYFEIKDWVYAGLKKPSWIDTFKICRVDEQYVVIKFAGYLSANDEARFVEFLSNLN
ncbi:hypothetical protein [Leuconostoc pseudomesenteroides]|uniref:Type II toxin-antitoxin system PemK/MazF family toxin n=1 Tax=Leuconostoc pseudomesenteroides TaxID=33968 RepID=A0ABT6HE18_LEUPS|nr:hypothetical protein [Leuconostoc pseudomesenteroides]MDG9734289.1 hypothetical protein [Leuconostoc pseudomesenteroides]NKZ36884.1 hypothetical protein [Leuconostoc pseudomesenteroides]QQB27758.1 hypothetical protein I6H60_01805 [Leuconostoc pseudomesenteroides]